MNAVAGEVRCEQTRGLDWPLQCQGTACLGREEEQCPRPTAKAAHLSGCFWCRAGKPRSVPCPGKAAQQQASAGCCKCCVVLSGSAVRVECYPLFPFPH